MDRKISNTASTDGVCAPLEVCCRHLFPVKEISFKSLDNSNSDDSSSGVRTLPTLLGNSCSGSSSSDDDSSSSDCLSDVANDGENALLLTSDDESHDDGKAALNRCTDCGRKTSATSRLNPAKRRGQCENEGCDALLCRTCKKRWVLMDRQPRSSSCDNNGKGDWRTASFKRFCKSCYTSLSTIDFNFHSEIIEPTDADEVGGCPVTMIFAHREGRTRASFRPHARYLAEKYGYRSILMDYAGHGSRFEEECTVKNCVDAVREVIRSYDISTAQEAELRGHKTVFASSSWGGLVARDVARELGAYFSGVIFDSCCFDPHAPMERLKRGCLSALAKRVFSNYDHVRLLRAWWSLQSRKDSYLDLVDGNFAAGVFRSTNGLRSTDPRQWDRVVSDMACPVLFVNGTKDNRGRRSRKKLLDRLGSMEECKLVFFEGGNDLVSHDLRFFNAWVEIAASFAHHASVLPPQPLCGGEVEVEVEAE